VTEDYGLRIYLDGLSVKELRDLAVDARYRHELRKAELIDFLLEYNPQIVREHREHMRAASENMMVSLPGQLSSGAQQALIEAHRHAWAALDKIQVREELKENELLKQVTEFVSPTRGGLWVLSPKGVQWAEVLIAARYAS
jgi:hypothetical protein